MSVYIDQERNRFGRMIMCHMWADTLSELHAMAESIGMDRAWFQPLSFPHYDVSLSRRAKAVANGAIEMDRRAGVQSRKAIRERGWSDDELAELRAAIPAYDAARQKRSALRALAESNNGE